MVVISTVQRTLTLYVVRASDELEIRVGNETSYQGARKSAWEILRPTSRWKEVRVKDWQGVTVMVIPKPEVARRPWWEYNG